MAEEQHLIECCLRYEEDKRCSVEQMLADPIFAQQRHEMEDTFGDSSNKSISVSNPSEEVINLGLNDINKNNKVDEKSTSNVTLASQSIKIEDSNNINVENGDINKSLNLKVENASVSASAPSEEELHLDGKSNRKENEHAQNNLEIKNVKETEKSMSNEPMPLQIEELKNPKIVQNEDQQLQQSEGTSHSGITPETRKVEDKSESVDNMVQQEQNVKPPKIELVYGLV